MPNLFSDVDEFPESDDSNGVVRLSTRHFGKKPSLPSSIQREFRRYPQQHSLLPGSSVRLPGSSVLESYVQLVLRARDIPAVISSRFLFAVGSRLSPTTLFGR